MTMRLLLLLLIIIALSFDLSVWPTRLSSAMVYAQSTNATAVLGQSDLFSSFSDSFGPGTDPSSLTPFGVRVRADDSVLAGVYVVDRPSHRVLYFPPGATAATRVYGQPDMYSNQSNRGAPNPSADSLNIPVGIEIASDGVYISDNGNHRVLFYPGTSTTATRVYGQGGNFSSGTAMTVSADSLFFPRGLFLDSANNLYVADWYNHRVLFFPAGSTTATRVYGQGGRFTTRDELLPPTVDSLNTPNSVTVSNTGVYIADYGNNRVLYYPGTSTTASIAFGHSGSFVTRDEESPPSAQSVNYPTSVTLDINCNLYVTSYWNHRVLVFPPGSTTATRVYGQLGDFSSGGSNHGGLGPWSLFNPFDAAIGDNELLITDVRNNRVLKYPLNDGTAAPNRTGPCSRNNTITAETTTTPPPGTGTTSTTTTTTTTTPTTTNTVSISANAVIGQADLFSAVMDPFEVSVDAYEVDPLGIAADNDGGVYVADASNNRVVYFPPGANSSAAIRVYGQPDMKSRRSNRGQGAFNASADSLSSPFGVALAADGVYISDSGNHRVLFYPGTSTTATRVYGQGGSFTTTGNNVSAASFTSPQGIFVDKENNLYVADQANNRVLFFPAGSTTATRVYGQEGSFTTKKLRIPPTADSLRSPIGVAASNNGVYIADHYNHRVLFYWGASTTASVVYGQEGSFEMQFSYDPPTAASMRRPASVTLDNNCNLYISSVIDNRVLFFPSGSTTATRVYGQGNFSSNTINNGGVGPASLHFPYDVDIGGNVLFIGDFQNKRVLKYPLNDGSGTSNGPCSRNTLPAETTPPPTPPTTTTTLSSLSPTTLSPPVSSAFSFSSPSSSWTALMIAGTLLFLFGFPSY